MGPIPGCQKRNHDPRGRAVRYLLRRPPHTRHFANFRVLSRHPHRRKGSGMPPQESGVARRNPTCFDKHRRVHAARHVSDRRVLNRVKPRVGNVERLRDPGWIVGTGLVTDASEGLRDRVSRAPIVERRVANLLRKLAIERETPPSLWSGVQRVLPTDPLVAASEADPGEKGKAWCRPLRRPINDRYLTSTRRSAQPKAADPN